MAFGGTIVFNRVQNKLFKEQKARKRTNLCLPTHSCKGRASSQALIPAIQNPLAEIRPKPQGSELHGMN